MARKIKKITAAAINADYNLVENSAQETLKGVVLGGLLQSYSTRVQVNKDT